ncbi:hypothetical protein B0H63DRAFT_543818 [Podospora didyma]|uniref:Rhodopsin domain-containing protein n=1 Tax=Podospora didyma TaxID=330526 RepID=A0AAE0NPX7_9PEZI|nr:hypothetical protein B0H63DRAFT_543818 [Podospora didyma]
MANYTSEASESPDESRRRAENYAPHLNATVWFLTAISAIFLGLRVFVKVWRKRRVRCDDCILVLGWIALAVSTAMITLCTTFGLGRHGRYIRPEDLSNLLMTSYFAGFASTLAVIWSKTSFAVTLLNISEGTTRKVVWFVLISANVVLGLNATLQFVQCWPPSRAWHPGAPGKCWLGIERVRAYNIFVAAYSGATDIVLALLPWKIIGHMKIRKKEKYGALFAMSMGVFAGITSFLKITSLGAIGNVDLITMVNLFIFGTAEGATTIIAASVPILRALLHRQEAPP